ncbi:IS66 family insertion sequence element accessory protein TnpB [uncultured Thiodictyon sp.]|uniref:IS66 family insertion sequence element accessory protein TnpB n=1 Tax=uncultured Thiodictyon sp. TaxID=1846217 RepID=UPI0025F0D30F|nr:IS66 family insertion sequence element accessory protein TnpB [uncultured Thiodictyon sp.]
MIAFGAHTQVYLALGATDMRKSIDGLAVLVAEVLMADPLSSHLFVFCNRAKDKIKILFWHNNGFWLWYRRLERQRFYWPQEANTAAVTVSVRELGWLLEGLDLRHVEAHRRADFSLL